MSNTATVQVTWSTDESAFFRAVVDATVNSPKFRGIRAAELYHPFHDPAISFHRKNSPLRQGARIKLIVSYSPGSKPPVTLKIDGPQAAVPPAKPKIQLPFAAPLNKWGDSLIYLLESNSLDGTSTAMIDFTVTTAELDLRDFRALSEGRTSPRSAPVPAATAVTGFLGFLTVAQHSNTPSGFTARFRVHNGAWILQKRELLAKIVPIRQNDATPIVETAQFEDEGEAIIAEVHGDRGLVLNGAAMLIAEHDPRRLDNILMSIGPFAIGKIGKLARLRKLARLTKLRALSKADILSRIKVPKAFQLKRGRYDVDIPLNPDILDHVLHLRKTKYGVEADDFGLNITVWDVTIDGKRGFIDSANVSVKFLDKKYGKGVAKVGFHSEGMVLAKLKKSKDVKVHRVYTERIPCSNCDSLLDADPLTKTTPVYYTLKNTKDDATNIEMLMEKYSIFLDPD